MGLILDEYTEKYKIIIFLEKEIVGRVIFMLK